MPVPNQVLLAEADDVAREELSRALTEVWQDFVVTESRTADDALNHVVTGRFDLYILDAELCLSQNLDLLSELAVNQPQASVLVLSRGNSVGSLAGVANRQEIVIANRDVETPHAIAWRAALTLSRHVLSQQRQLTESMAKMNQDLSRLYVELSAKDEQMDRFIHLISHDLRAPVVAIQGLAELLVREHAGEPVDSRPRRYLDLIMQGVEQVKSLTTALIDYAKLGSTKLRLADVDTAQLVQDIWQRLSFGQQEIDLEIFSALPVVRADAGKLSQVFQNLFENAIKYRCPERKTVVDVTCADGKDWWQFTINDNGTGFDPADNQRIFDLFARLKSASDKPGTGIGLASVMEIARLHGGKAWAMGRPGKGSTFYFTLSKVPLEHIV